MELISSYGVQIKNIDFNIRDTIKIYRDAVAFCIDVCNKEWINISAIKKPDPKPVDSWNCTCGAVASGKFCQECGAKKPTDVPLYCCDKCGWELVNPKNPPKFCPECGDRFDDADIKSAARLLNNR